jgi:hypothetical protein
VDIYCLPFNRFFIFAHYYYFKAQNDIEYLSFYVPICDRWLSRSYFYASKQQLPLILCVVSLFGIIIFCYKTTIFYHFMCHLSPVIRVLIFGFFVLFCGDKTHHFWTWIKKHRLILQYSSDRFLKPWEDFGEMCSTDTPHPPRLNLVARLVVVGGWSPSVFT